MTLQKNYPILMICHPLKGHGHVLLVLKLYKVISFFISLRECMDFHITLELNQTHHDNMSVPLYCRYVEYKF